MSENNMDIFSVTETWQHDKADWQYVTANIQSLDYNRTSIERQNRKGGGIACIYKKNIEISNCPQTLMNLWNTNSKPKNKIQ